MTSPGYSVRCASAIGRFGAPLPLPADEPIPATVIILEDREPWQCVWPVNHGEPRYLYCGARKAPGEKRFCATHAARAYRERSLA